MRMNLLLTFSEPMQNRMYSTNFEVRKTRDFYGSFPFAPYQPLPCNGKIARIGLRPLYNQNRHFGTYWPSFDVFNLHSCCLLRRKKESGSRLGMVRCAIRTLPPAILPQKRSPHTKFCPRHYAKLARSRFLRMCAIGTGESGYLHARNGLQIAKLGRKRQGHPPQARCIVMDRTSFQRIRIRGSLADERARLADCV